MNAERLGLNRDVVVTGVGLVTPLGWGTDETWDRLCAGECAARWLDELTDPADSRAPRWAGMPVPGVSPRDPFRLRQFALAAGREALEHSRLDIGSDIDPSRVGCVLGVSKSDLTAFSCWASGMRDGHRMDDVTGEDELGLIHAALWPNDAATRLAGEFGIHGAVLCPMAACATGLVSIIRGIELIREGGCDAVLAGSVDASLTPSLLGCYSRLKVLASGFDEPISAMRPFGVRRNGFLVGEGAGVVLLESAELARSRRQQPIARVLACALANDSTGMTDIDTTGETLARVICDALQRSRLAPHDIDVVQVHGTATWQNDVCESRALRAVWKADSVPPVSSIKGAIGHLLGGAGSVEAALAVLTLRDQRIPPAVNAIEIDPDCGLDLSTQTRELPIRRILKLSLGFGGHLAAVVFEHVGTHTETQ